VRNIDIAKSLTKLYASPAGRKLLRNGRISKSSVVICQPSDEVVATLRRIARWDSNGALVVFAAPSGELRCIDIRPAMNNEDGSIGAQRVNRVSSIEMLYHVAEATGETRFQLHGEWARDGVASVRDYAEALSA